MDDLRSELAAAAEASGIVSHDEDTDAESLASAAVEAPESDDSPAADDPALASAADDEDAEYADDDDEEAPAAEPSVEEMRAQLAELQRERDEERQRQLQWQQEQQRQQAEVTRQEWVRAEAGLEDWLFRSMGTLQQNRINDERLIAESSDPNALRAQLAQVRHQEENWIRGQYGQQKAVYDNHKTSGLYAAYAQSQVRAYAQETARAYKLPETAVEAVMAYADGTPVHPDAMPARAAELAHVLNERKQLKRQLTQAQRSARAREMSGQSVSPGKGGNPPAEFTDWREELAWAAAASGIGPQTAR